MLKTVSAIILGCAWLGLAAFGLVRVARYDSAPEAVNAIKGDFPSGSIIHLNSATPTVVLFVHPACPCTQASVHQLAEAQAQASRKANIYILIAKPAGHSFAKEAKEMRKLAEQVQGAQVLDDVDCKEAVRFQATVSGQCFVYDPKGKLTFSGGLTRARGHYGTSLGSDTVLALLNGQPTTVRNAPVFGCYLR